jgi:hypothetical protein
MYNIPKVYQGRNCFFDRALVDVHFAQLIAEFDLRDYYTIPQLEEKYKMSHMAVLSFVQRNKIPRITQGRKVYYSKAAMYLMKLISTVYCLRMHCQQSFPTECKYDVLGRM